MLLKKTLRVGLMALLVMSITVVVAASPWDGVPDDYSPAQSIWVDPMEVTCLSIDDTFVVDVLVNITDPDGPATGMWGWQYQLAWDSTILEVVEVQTHGDNNPPGDLLPGHTMVLVADNTTTTSNHTYLVVPLAGSAFTGVDSLCTYKFKVIGEGSCALDLIETGPKQVKLTHDQGDVLDITITDATYCPVAVQYQLTIEVEGSGTTNPPPGSHMYNEGTLVSVDAIPASGWKLDHWKLDNINVSASDPYDVTMDNNHTLTAIFTERPPSELLGDINGDKIVDIEDATICSLAMWSEPGDPKWNPDADLNGDNLINIFDLVIIGVNFGNTA